MIGGFVGRGLGVVIHEDIGVQQLSRFDSSGTYYTDLLTITLLASRFNNTETFYTDVFTDKLFAPFVIDTDTRVETPVVNQTFKPTIDYPPSALRERNRHFFYFDNGFWRKSTGFFK